MTQGTRRRAARAALATVALLPLLLGGGGVEVAWGWFPVIMASPKEQLVPVPKVFYRPQPGNPAFQDPRGIAIDSHGNVWVANAGSDSVTEILREGGYRKKRTYGGPATHFDHPHDLAIDHLDDVWVVSRHGVTALYAKDRYMDPDYYSQRRYAVRFRERDIAVDPSAPWPVSLFVTGSKREILHIYGTPGKNMEENLSILDGDPAIPRTVLEGMAADGHGHVFIANRGGSIIRENLKNGHLGPATVSVGTDPKTGKGVPFHNPPVLLALDPSGNLWSTDPDTHMVSILYIRPDGNLGNGKDIPAVNPPPDDPRGLAVDGRGNLWFPNHNTGRLNIIPPGRFKGATFRMNYYSIKDHGRIFHARRIAIDDRGNVWMTGDEGVVRANPPPVVPVRTPLLGLPGKP